jgi:ATP-dependent NAD(P)H-hydrate dehydratase
MRYSEFVASRGVASPPRASPTATAATDHAAAASSSSSDALPPSVAALVPTLSLARKKGACGVVGVLGGCAEYAGAPFFAAMASIRRVLYTGPHTTASAW